jgi:cellulose synthase/poly-beta-1,6-N-acetylglucosamine synthase-like glycosyltransferase
LRAIGAWDPYNVTEDADLGLRLARFGYRAVAIQSTTYEEAPPQFGPWLRQRTRWFKGWMQTWWTHTRAPKKAWEELGPFGFTIMQLIVGGNVLASLVHPFMLVWLLFSMLLPEPVFVSTPTAILFAMTIAAGYAASALLGLIGLCRRRLLRHAWVLLLIPVNWLLLAAASWRALFQLFTDPHRWEKTEHGLARTSRVKDRQAIDDIIAEILKPPQGSAAAASLPAR